MRRLWLLLCFALMPALASAQYPMGPNTVVKVNEPSDVRVIKFCFYMSDTSGVYDGGDLVSCDTLDIVNGFHTKGSASFSLSDMDERYIVITSQDASMNESAQSAEIHVIYQDTPLEVPDGVSISIQIDVPEP